LIIARKVNKKYTKIVGSAMAAYYRVLHRKVQLLTDQPTQNGEIA